MGQFNKIPSLIQIWLTEFLAVMFLFPAVSNLYEWLHPAAGYHSLPLGIEGYVFFVIGLSLYAWVLTTIFRPAVHATRFVPVFHGGGVVVANPQMAAEYLFASTHPSYVFVDLLSCAFWWFVRWLWSEGWEERAFQGTILLVMSLAIPAIRLLAWYGLRLRPRVDANTKEELRSSWKPVAILYGLFGAIAIVCAAFIIPSELRDRRERADREAKLTVLDAASWHGALSFGELRDPGKTNAPVTRVVRLRGIQKSVEATGCGNKPEEISFATVVATVGRDDILIFTSTAPSDLIRRAAGNEGKRIEAIGRLGPMPDEPPSWKKFCRLEDLPRRPRWLFEEEKP